MVEWMDRVAWLEPGVHFRLPLFVGFSISLGLGGKDDNSPTTGSPRDPRGKQEKRGMKVYIPQYLGLSLMLLPLLLLFLAKANTWRRH